MPAALLERLRLLRQEWGWPLVITACIGLLPIGRTVELPMAVLAIAGMYLVYRQGMSLLDDPMVPTWLGLFACIWLPMVFALPDAYKIGRGLETTLVFLRFAFMGLFILYLLRLRPEWLNRILWLVAGVAVLWGLDALLQAYGGRDLFGFQKLHGEVVTGVFHPKQTLGHVLAVLSPLVLLAVAQSTQTRRWLWSLLPLYVLAVLLTGKRVAWIMLAGTVVLGWLWLWMRLPARRRAWITLGVLGMGALTLALAVSHPSFSSRWQATFAAANLDEATAYRVTIWQVGARIFSDHWLNGVGPRAFRNVYPAYAQPGDLYLQINPKAGPTHPHQITLEIAVETGTIGLIGFALLWIWLLREGWTALRQGHLPYYFGLGAAALAFLPINAGHALYDAKWSGIAFWLLILALAHRPRS